MNKRLSLATAAATLLCMSANVDAKPIHSAGTIGVGLGSGPIANGLSLKYFMSDNWRFKPTSVPLEVEEAIDSKTMVVLP